MSNIYFKPSTSEQIRDEGVKQLRLLLKALKAKGFIEKFEVTKNKAIKSPFGNKYTVKILRTLPQRSQIGAQSMNALFGLFLPGELSSGTVTLDDGAGQKVAYARTKFWEQPLSSFIRDPQTYIPKAEKAFNLLNKLITQENFLTSQGADAGAIAKQMHHILKSYK